MSENLIKQQIIALSKSLRLPTIRNNYDQIIDEAQHNNADYNDFLHSILMREKESRDNQALINRMRASNFPQKKYLEDLCLEDLPDGARKNLKALASLKFIQEKRNLILSGNPGTGKTHIATALGIKACHKEYRVLFVSVPRLIIMLKESRSERTLRTMENRFQKYDLLICDEFGYISFDKEGAELLFSLLSLRCANKSTIVTTNLDFNRWTEIFGDPVLTAAMVDRLTHKAILVNMNGNSFRAKETASLMAKEKND